MAKRCPPREEASSSVYGSNQGIYEEDLTLESVAKRIDEICDEDDYVVPDDVDQNAAFTRTPSFRRHVTD